MRPLTNAANTLNLPVLHLERATCALQWNLPADVSASAELGRLGIMRVNS